MRSKVINDDSERTYVLVFETGEEVVSGLLRFAQDHNLTASRFTAIGALRDATLGYFDWQAKDYRKIPIA